MKDYSAMSDEDINKLVAGHISFADKVMVGTGQIDYCNNPADAWPIIMDNNIAVIPYRHTLPCAWPTAFGMASKFTTEDKNPLRAAMVTFLMMKDRESSHAKTSV
ncbi:TPA: phage protein NinX family protein [Yersinia enterocolitica]|uniref:phage protein NinX family protein n=1 Tax=Yersinia enterocolitica TaxID=630 RepID=UPI002A0D6E1B|nr:DUF2591 domain-containing protein [Yersinia enterocolitica]ELY5205681.1 DUF2591 family protein [Yersinia enterocolitica]ELY5242656.1 DUF2591 family protein [Yersinia enterocolitica]